MIDGSLPRIIVLGQESNLTKAIGRQCPTEVLSARAMNNGGAGLPADGEFVLVINAFRPATRLQHFEDPYRFLNEALGATARALGQLRDSGCVFVLYTSSAVVYGPNELCREQDPLMGKGLHASLKAAGEELTEAACHETGMPWAIARPFNVFGGQDRFSVVARLTESATSGRPFRLSNDGRSIRDFVHVDDVAKSYVHFARSRPSGVINVASGRGTRIADLVELARRVNPTLRVSSTARDEVPVSVADVGRLATFVDVNAFIDVRDFLMEGLRR